MMKKLLCTFLVVLLSSTLYAQDAVSGGNPLTDITTSSVEPPVNIVTPTDGTDFETVIAGENQQNDFVFTSGVAGPTRVVSVTITSDPNNSFIESAAVPSNVNNGDTSDFNIVFAPDPAATAGDDHFATIRVRVGPPVIGPFTDFYYQVRGTVGAAVPGISVTGDDSLEVTLFAASGGNADFGEVVGGNNETVTRQYTIENTGSAPLTINDIYMNSGSNVDFEIVLPNGVDLPATPEILNPGATLVFSVAYSPDDPAVEGLPNFDDSDFVVIDTEAVGLTDPTDLFFEVIGVGIAPFPIMEVYGDNVLISGDDTNTPNTGNFTLFEDTDIATVGGSTRTFTITNSGTADLELNNTPLVRITGVDLGDFSISINPSTPITPTNSTTFTVTFDPTTIGVKNATIEIDNNSSIDPYIFDISGTATENTGGGFNQLMFTQYYEGEGSNKWLEIKNVSSTATITGAYHLALYINSLGTIGGGIETLPPESSYEINFSIPAGGVVLFGNSAATLPPPGNRGSATTINDGSADGVLAFTGDDIILITTSNDTNAYGDRVDILGEVSTGNTAIDWGTDMSLIKGCGTTEQPAIIYDPTNIAYDENQFIELTLEEVNNADPDTNIALGTQTVGSTTWGVGASDWDNGDPDKTKSAIIDGAYTNSDGSFEACDLTINGSGSIDLDSGGTGSNYVLVDNNLTINGSFAIGDTEALVMTNDDAVISGSITKIESTTPLNNFRDLTYWSSPVSTTIEAAFINPNPGVDPNRIWFWRTPSSGDTGNWVNASGTMQTGRSYIAEAPSSITTGQQYTVNFTGTPNNGVVNVPVGIDPTNGDGFGGYNIIGNPYPSAIDIDLFITEQANPEIDEDPTATIDGTIYLWTHGTPIDGSGEFTPADYATYNLAGGVATTTGSPAPTNVIGSGQGFLIQVFQAGNNEVTFENYMRLTDQNDAQFFKSNNTQKASEEKNRVWLDMTSAEGDFNQVLVGFFDKASDGYDRAYDGRYISGGNTINFYSNLGNDILAIQGLGTFDQSKTVSLGFYASEAKTYKISISKIEGLLKDEDVYLLDNKLNIIHDLKQGDYEFEVDIAGNYSDRFTLKFNNAVLGVDDVQLNNNFVVMNEENGFRLKSNSVITDLKIYDISGRLLIDKRPDENEFSVLTSNIRKGTVLILNATLEGGIEISKKAIKY